MVWFKNTLGLGIGLSSKLLGVSVVGLVLSGCNPMVNTKASTAASGGSGSSTVTDLGTLDPTVAWLGAGNYSAVDLTTLPAAKVCSDKSIFGTTGTATCQAGTASDAAIAANVVAGKQYWDSTGTLVTGTLSSQGTWDLRLAFPGSGIYTGVSNAPTAGQVCSSASGGIDVLGVSGSAVCQSGTVTSDATLAPKLLSGQSLYDSAGHVVAGSMATRTLSAASTTVNAGYYAATTLTAVDSDLVSSNIKSGITIFGVAGSSSVVDTASGDAVAGDMLSGKKAYVNGSLVTGSITTSSPTQSAVASGSENDDSVTSVNVTPTAGNLFSGFTVSVGAQFKKANICSGKTIFGRAGTALCNLVFGDLTGSGAHRDIATTQVALSSEVNQGTCSDNSYTTRKSCESNSATWTATALQAGYRARPVVNKDHDGFYPAGGGNDPSSNPNPSNQITKADTSGIVSCGTTQPTIEGRIADCAYSWDGATQGNSAQGKWTLVTKTAGNYEVWRDERTQLIWGDNMGTNNWCQAAGNSENSGDDNQGWTVDCTPGAGSGLQPATPVSMCAEDTGFTSDGYDDQKGGMRLTATGTSPSVAWRLPTRDDMLQAYANGAGYVMNVFRDGNNYWTASVNSYYRSFAWYFYAVGYGNMLLGHAYRDGSVSVRCVGR